MDLEQLKKCGVIDDDHDWGYQIRVVNNELYSGKFMILENSKSGSMHYHKKKKETFIVLCGKVMIGYLIPSDHYEPEDDPHTCAITSEYGPGSKITMERKQAHLMWAKEYPAVILEIATHDDDSDTYRIRQS